MDRTSQGLSADSRKLILIRHAHRDNSVRSLDNGLSVVGHEQAQKLFDFFKLRYSLSEIQWMSSPKLRCVETLLPMAGNRLRIEPLLDEQNDSETHRHMENRVESFLNYFKGSKEKVTVACSHGDWIPAAVHKMTGLHTELGKSGWISLSYTASQDLWVIEDSKLSI